MSRAHTLRSCTVPLLLALSDVMTAGAADRGARVPVEAPSAVAMAEAEAAYVHGDYERAARLLQTLVQVEQQNAFAWVRLGHALRQRASYPEAWRAYDRAIELVSVYPNDRDARAVELEARRGRAQVSIDAAMTDMEAVRRLSSDTALEREARATLQRLLIARDASVDEARQAPASKPIRATGVVRTQPGSGAKPVVTVIQGGSNNSRQR